MSAPPRIVAYVPDLMDRSRIQAAVPGVHTVAAPTELADAAGPGDVVVVDLAVPGVLEAVGAVTGRVIGFAPHVDRELLAAATAAGCDHVLPRSQFFRRAAELLGRSGAPEQHDADGQHPQRE